MSRVIVIATEYLLGQGESVSWATMGVFVPQPIDPYHYVPTFEEQAQARTSDNLIHLITQAGVSETEAARIIQQEIIQLRKALQEQGQVDLGRLGQLVLQQGRLIFIPQQPLVRGEMAFLPRPRALPAAVSSSPSWRRFLLLIAMGMLLLGLVGLLVYQVQRFPGGWQALLTGKPEIQPTAVDTAWLDSIVQQMLRDSIARWEQLAQDTLADSGWLMEQDTAAVMDSNFMAVDSGLQVRKDTSVGKTGAEPAATLSPPEVIYLVISASFPDSASAAKAVQRWRRKGWPNAAIYRAPSGRWRLAIDTAWSRARAQEKLQQVRKQVEPGAWIWTYRVGRQ